MNTNTTAPKNKYNIWIWIVSIAIPVAVAILFTVRIPGVERMGFLASHLCKCECSYCRIFNYGTISN